MKRGLNGGPAIVGGMSSDIRHMMWAIVPLEPQYADICRHYICRVLAVKVSFSGRTLCKEG